MPSLAVMTEETPADASAPEEATPAQPAVAPSPDAKTLAKIFELNREVTRCADDFLAKKEAAGNAKKRWEAAQEWLNAFINKNEFPLLDQPADAEADTNPDTPAEAWRSKSVLVLGEDHGLPAAVADKLIQGGLGTIGKIADWTAAGKPLTDVKGIGEKAAGQIDEALAEFWEANRVEDEAEPVEDREEDDETTITVTADGQSITMSEGEFHDRTNTMIRGIKAGKSRATETDQ